MRFRLAAPGLLAVLALSACENTSTSPDRGWRAVAGVSVQTQDGPRDTPCVGDLTGTFQNVFVPPGQTCRLLSATLTGNLKALENSRLFAFDNSIAGNIEADRASEVIIVANRVGQNVNINDGPGSPALTDYSLCNSTVNGNIHVIRNTGGIILGEGLVESAFVPPSPFHCVPNRVVSGSIRVEDNTILTELSVSNNDVTTGGHVQVNSNVGGTSKRVRFNSVRKSVQCSDNVGAFEGGPNIAPKSEGQCF
jgi:hypothetical protein